MAEVRPVLLEKAVPAPDVSVVVTLLNEAGTVDELYRRTAGALADRAFELLFVDDGSTDGTFARLEGLHAADARVRSGGASVVEVDVAHFPRDGGSRYSPLRLVRLALHVLAGFWPQPIQWIGIALGMICTLLATGLGAYGVFYWIDRSNFPGPLFGGVAVLFVLGIQGFILALIGEYLGRIQRDVEGRPLYVVDREL